jgi:hypothetical protein
VDRISDRLEVVVGSSRLEIIVTSNEGRQSV